MNTEQPLLRGLLLPARQQKYNCYLQKQECSILYRSDLLLHFPVWNFIYATINVKTFFILLFIAFTNLLIAQTQNAITIENALPGTPAAIWDVSGAGDLSIQGFATDISYNKGSTAIFKINTTAAYTIDIYRIGYYQGNGARFIANLGTFAGTVQPACITQAKTGLTDCGNWSQSATWIIPANAVSGIYIAKLTRSDNNGASHIAFVVRDDSGNSDILFKTADATWQAYNGYDGNNNNTSLYTGGAAGPPVLNHASKVSYNRPFLTRAGGAGGGASEDWIFNAEYPMIRWLERNGYDVSYFTDVDADRIGSEILEHDIFLSVGHDEYWSAAERTNVEAARDAGVNLAFFSGNEVYWKTRWENSIDGSGTSYRTLVCYKEGTVGENVCGSKCDPEEGVWTGLWREGCSPTYTTDACLPENALTGQISWDPTTTAIQVPDTYKNFRFWNNTTIANLGNGQTATLPNGTLGYEWDFENAQYASFYPSRRITLSSTNFNNRNHKLSLYRHASGALVFGAGTVQWSWGLDSNHDRGNEPASADMQQATVNLFAFMGVTPASLQAGLIVPTNENQAPVSAITTPITGAILPICNAITIAGTASEAAGIVAGVEVSVDGGTTWQMASGTNNWTFNWTPAAAGTYTILSRAYDDLGNLEVPAMGSANYITVTVTTSGAGQCSYSIWNTSDTPGTITENDNQAIEVGVKFRSTLNGYITGIRFYKSPQNTGTHTGNLWSTNGTNLGQVIFTGETASGWQQVFFSNPVPINANTTYIASYHTTSGYYSEDEGYFQNQGINNPPLRALQNGEDGANSIYSYSATSTFPTSTFNASNYWVDVVFVTDIGPDVTAPTVQSTSPVNNASGVAINTTVTATFSEAIDPNTVSNATFELRDGSNNLVTANVSYNIASRTAMLTPTTALNYSSTYTVKVTGGTTDPRIKDLAGNALQNNFIWTFTTAAPPPPPPTEGPGGPILVISAASNPFSRYPVEILRAEGLNEFFAIDISQVTANVLEDYDVVILGEQPLNATQATLLSDWVDAGGILIAFRPDADLATLLGLTPVAGTLSEGYLLINNAGPGTGIVNQTIQFHGAADYYTLNGATSLATLYSNATTSTIYPAVTTRNVGSNGGKAIAFTYDLAKSIVYTRQGNPAWAGQNRDGSITDGVIRSNDLFFGNASGDPQTDWVNLDKVQIPQADEQQRFLANIIIQNNLETRPLPRFWYFPNKFKAAVVMTGDDHAGGLTDEFFNTFISLSPANCSVEDWECVRGSSYVFTNTNIGGLGATAYQNLGFEVGIHINTGCNVWTPASLVNDFNSQLAQFANLFPNITPPSTHRTHCIAWSDWATQAKQQALRGIRLDVNYYYWPGSWAQNRPGMFTGSGMPMRFADLDGTIIDCYQVATQITDETEPPAPPTYVPFFINTLLDNAIGANGYYGAFCMNMHTDRSSSLDLSQTIINAAQTRGVPVIAAKQLLNWLDGRNGSSFQSITWNGNALNFSIAVGAGANNLYAMLPLNVGLQSLSTLMVNGNPVAFTTETIKGIAYAFFPATAGNYIATYAVPAPATLSGTVTFQGRTDYTSPITIKLYQPGTNIQIGTDYNTTTTATGNFSLPNLPAGTFDIYVKKDNYLQKKLANVILPNGGSFTGDFGMLSASDANNDNFVSLTDFSILLNTYNKASGDSSYDARADFNGDGLVNLTDFSLLLNNYNTAGAIPPN